MCKFLRENKNFNGAATGTRWGECFKLILGEETHFPGGSSFYLGGAGSQRVLTGGVKIIRSAK